MCSVLVQENTRTLSPAHGVGLTHSLIRLFIDFIVVWFGGVLYSELHPKPLFKVLA